MEPRQYGTWGDRDLKDQKNEWPEECLLSSPNFPSQRPRWQMGRASGATQTAVVHNEVHRGEVEDMNGWRWNGERGMSRRRGESRRIESSRGRSGMGMGWKWCQDQGGASVSVLVLFGRFSRFTSWFFILLVSCLCGFLRRTTVSHPHR